MEHSLNTCLTQSFSHVCFPLHGHSHQSHQKHRRPVSSNDISQMPLLKSIIASYQESAKIVSHESFSYVSPHVSDLLIYSCSSTSALMYSSPLWQPSSTISWCDQLPSSSAALSSSSLSSASLSSSSLSLESRAPAPPPVTTVSDDMESDERPYVCDLCTCAYKHASSLLNHKLTHKTGDFR